MNSFNFYSPTEFVFGQDTENQSGSLVRKYGGSRVLVHYGSGSAVRSGLLGRVTDSLERAGLTYILLGGVQPNPRDTKIREGIAICKQENIDFILSVEGVFNFRRKSYFFTSSKSASTTPSSSDFGVSVPAEAPPISAPAPVAVPASLYMASPIFKET